MVPAQIILGTVLEFHPKVFTPLCGPHFTSVRFAESPLLSLRGLPIAPGKRKGGNRRWKFYPFDFFCLKSNLGLHLFSERPCM